MFEVVAMIAVLFVVISQVTYNWALIEFAQDGAGIAKSSIQRLRTMFLDTAEAIDGQWILKNRPSARISPRDPKPPFHRFAEIQGEQQVAAAKLAASETPTPKLRSDDLFHSFTNSPIPEIRRRAAFMRQHAYCPHPEHRATRVPTIAPHGEENQAQTGQLAPAHVDFECPDCGVPVYCSKEHWMDNYEAHLEICDTLREINEDDHDLRSGRAFPEFVMAEDQMPEAVVNMTNWDTFMYSREFEAVNDERSMRQVTKMLTYPVTIGNEP
ncbi:Mss51p [Colletotrichum higginsianum]|uniref:Mss51p n=1 Tax=Colletotrichum higginsianum (strain IMI 349063) TaxID=759273 RepID=H1W5E3_COLHI|nr:Mss51p [Colletotrichum higginsianum]